MSDPDTYFILFDVEIQFITIRSSTENFKLEPKGKIDVKGQKKPHEVKLLVYFELKMLPKT